MAEPRATRREWTGLAIIALPCAVYAMLLIGAAAFGAASAAAAFARSAEMLIALRALLGVWIASDSVGSALGPLVGGPAARRLRLERGVLAGAAGDGLVAAAGAAPAARVQGPGGRALGGALDAARALGGEAGAALLQAARRAFVHATDVVAVRCAAIVVATAVLAGRILRRA